MMMMSSSLNARTNSSINSGSSHNNTNSNNNTSTDHEMQQLLRDDNAGSSTATAGSNNGNASLSSNAGGGTTPHASTTATATATTTSSAAAGGVSRTGLAVLLLLAVQNCSKNLLLRYVMKDRPAFLTSAAVLTCEGLKLTASVAYICLYEQRSLQSIVQYLRDDYRNTILLAVPAAAYNFQMTLEYIALAHLNAAAFSVLVQTKLLCTACFSAAVLRTQLRYRQVVSLVLLTVGVMLCNMSPSTSSSSTSQPDATSVTGVTATLGIAVSSGFASVYTEKVIKAQRRPAAVTLGNSSNNDYGLAYTQVQLALMSLATIGVYACVRDYRAIVTRGLYDQFTGAAWVSVANSAAGGLIVAAVLKYADSVLKGYATALSVVLTGVLSMLLFGTRLPAVYFLGIVNVVTAVVLYNGRDLERFVCSGGSPSNGSSSSANSKL